MYDYVTYTLWRQREERMPHELEQQRVAQERQREQQQSSQHQHEVPVHHDSTTEVEPELVEPEEPSAELRGSEAELVSR